MKTQKYKILHSFLLLFFGFVRCFLAQNTNETVLGGDKISVSPPVNVSASDEKYYDHVEISWQAVAKDYDYRVFRSTHRDLRKIEPVTKDWIKSTTCSDQLGFKQARYFYCVKARQGLVESAYSSVDEGSLLIVAGENRSVTQAINFSILGLSTTECAANAPFTVSFALENKENIPLSNIAVKFYLSLDDRYDAQDMLLTTTTVPSLDAHATVRLPVNMTAPKLVGSYHIIMVVGEQNTVFTSKKLSIK